VQFPPELLARWNAHCNDEGAGLETLISVYGTRSSIGRTAVRGTDNLVDLCGVDDQLRSPAAALMIKHGIRRKKLRCAPMGFETHLALLGYYREKRELLHELSRVAVDRHRIAMQLRLVVGLVERIEESNVKIMPHADGRRGGRK
jgi:hypothetical protein